MREKAERPAKRKLTRAERKQIEMVIRQAKGDGKSHTVQDSIPFQNMFSDGLCRLEGGTFSKTIAFEDVNYRLAGPEEDVYKRQEYQQPKNHASGLCRKKRDVPV